MGENLLYSGVWDRAYEYFGAHPAEEGWVFRVWAPHARHVALTGDFSGWEQWGMVRLEDGTWELPMAIERMKKNTRVYAKKQMTWYKHDDSIRWFHPDQLEDIFQYVDTHTQT